MLSLLYTFQAKKLIEGEFILAAKGQTETHGLLSFEQYALCPNKADSPDNYVACSAATSTDAIIFYIPVDKVHADTNTYTKTEIQDFVKASDVNVVLEVDERQHYFAIDTNANSMRGYDTKKLWVVENGNDMTGYEILM